MSILSKSELEAIAEALRIAIEKSEVLEKRSKNVRQQTRNILPEQAKVRRAAYASSLGLKPKHTGSVPGTPPAANRNTLPYDNTFPVTHEAAHAMMTPEGSTIRQYQKQLTQHANLPNYNENEEAYQDAIPEHESAVYDENVANAMENLIDRRAGVDPSKFRSRFRIPTAPDSTLTTEGYGIGRIKKPRHAPTSEGVEPFTEDIKEEARNHASKFDLGAKFTGQGRIKQPTDVNAKINRAQAGVDWLRSVRAKLKA